MYRFLENLEILDLSERLPGPYSTFILGHFGAKVIKLENSDRGGDTFQLEEAKEHYPNFIDWYKNLNANKDIQCLSFSKQKDELFKAIASAHIIIKPENRFFNQLLSEVELKSDQVLITLSGGRDEWKSLHDLNALALTETFAIHLEQNSGLPYLPFAGLGFGQYLATAMLAARIKALESNSPIKQTLYLQDFCIQILDILKTQPSEQAKKYLHNGLYPSYNIYKSADGASVCLGAIEEKYWENLINCFDLNLKPLDRFDTSEKTFEYLKKTFAKYTAHEIKEKIKDNNMCLTLKE